MNANIFAKANQILKNSTDAYFGVTDESGYPSVSTVSVINPENIFELYFSTGLQSNKVKRLQSDKRASICFHIGNDNVTLVGEAEILTDQETKSRYWMGWLDHFPGGETDPAYCIIKFTAKRVSLWIDNEDSAFTIYELLTVQSRCGLLCHGCNSFLNSSCKGCIALNGKASWRDHGYCNESKCCIDKGFNHCGECPDFPCEGLRGMSCGDDDECDKPKGARIAVCKAWAERNRR